MKKLIKILLVPLIALVLAAACELLLFNRLSVFSLGQSWTALPAPELSGDLGKDRELTLSFRDVGLPVRRCHLALELRDADGALLPVELTVSISDDGAASLYEAGTVRYFPTHDKGAYFQLDSYGALHELSVKLTTAQDGCSFRLLAAEINGSVPFRISALRLAGLFVLFLLLWFLRPGSPIYDNRLWNRRRWAKLLCVLLVLLLNLFLLANLGRLNPSFLQTPEGANWRHHQQYARLARALAEGRTWIDGAQDRQDLALLETMKDPYDPSARYALFEAAGRTTPWDLAYHEGHYYVYFGVVPVLLFYLPCYLLTGRDLPTVLAVWTSFALVLLGAFLLLRGLIRRYFPNTPFALYLLLSLLFGNGCCLLLYSMMPSFYVLPICLSLAFVCFALALWFSAAERWTRRKGCASPEAEDAEACFRPHAGRDTAGAVDRRILLGSLFAALTAGCRPQFLVFSALAIPLLWPLIRREEQRASRVKRLLCFALPYLAVALPLAYYNQIRFGSPFDFGANYNLTTNNMPLRGWRIARLPDGILDYLFRFPNLDLRFPYLHESASAPLYLGRTVREPMYGGVLLLHPFLWLLLRYRRAGAVLRERGLRCLCLLPLALTLVVIVADTEMAGILVRYTGDFLPLLYLSAMLIFLARWKDAEPRKRRALTAFLLAALLVTALLCFLMSVNDSGLLRRSPENYYRLKDLLS